MKIFLFVAATILSISAFSQAFMHPRNMRDDSEMKNSPLKKPSIISNAPFANPVDMTEYFYDTIRELTEINIPNIEDAHPWISSDGLRLYYTSGFYNDQMVVAERSDVNSFFGVPTLVPIINNEGAISYWLSKDELDVYIAYGWDVDLYYSHRNAMNLPFEMPVHVILDGISGLEYLCEASLDATQNELFIFDYGSPVKRILEFERYAGHYYDYVRTISAPSGYSLVGGQLSKDDLTFYTGAKNNEENWELYEMTRATPSDTFDTSTFQLISGINDTSGFNAFPSMSDSLEWVAFNRAPTGDWFDIDLYLAHNGILTSVFNPAEPQIFSYAFPNPSSEYINIKYKTSSVGSMIASVYSYEGVLVFENVFKTSQGIIKINTSSWNNGFYCYRLTQQSNQKNRAVTGKFVVIH